MQLTSQGMRAMFDVALNYCRGASIGPSVGVPRRALGEELRMSLAETGGLRRDGAGELAQRFGSARLATVARDFPF